MSGTVAIVGAGLTGLAAAQALRKHGFAVAVYDREAHMDARPRDWTLVLHWALPTLEALLPADVAARLPRAVCNRHLAFDARAESFPVYNGVTGELLFASPLPGSRRVSRRRLRRLLAEGIDVQWGRTVVGIGEADQTAGAATSGASGASGAGLALTFDDGTTAAADFVLAADGAQSRLRALAVGDAARAQSTSSGLLCATAVVQYHDAAKTRSVTDLHPVAAVAMGVGAVAGSGVLYADDEDAPDDAPPRPEADWTLFWLQIWPGRLADLVDEATGRPVPTHGPGAVRYLQARDTTARLAEPFRSHVAWTDPDAADCRIDEMKYWVPVAPISDDGGDDGDPGPASPTRDHRLALAGDAAHPMLVYRGQGYQHAITDVDHYVRALLAVRAAAWDPAVRRREMAAYSAEVAARGATAVQQSVDEAAKSFDADKVRTMMMAQKGHGRSA